MASLLDAFLVDFTSAAEDYEKRRLESLPENEYSLLKEWLEPFSEGDEQDVAWSEARMIVSAVRNGFRPSEYIDSMRQAVFKQLRAMGVDPMTIVPPDAPDGAADRYLGLHMAVWKWMIAEGRVAEFTGGLGQSNEIWFWRSMNLKDSGAWELARDGLIDVVKDPAIGRRKRLAALQSLAWCHFHLEEFEDALAVSERLVSDARLPDSRILAGKCIGYVTALRDFNIDPEQEYILALPDAEFDDVLNEPLVIRQAEEIRTGKLTTMPSKPFSQLEEVCPEVGQPFRAAYPFSNVMRLRGILRQCRDYIWWADPHFGPRALGVCLSNTSARAKRT